MDYTTYRILLKFYSKHKMHKESKTLYAAMRSKMVGLFLSEDLLAEIFNLFFSLIFCRKMPLDSVCCAFLIQSFHPDESDGMSFEQWVREIFSSVENIDDTMLLSVFSVAHKSLQPNMVVPLFYELDKEIGILKKDGKKSPKFVGSALGLVKVLNQILDGIKFTGNFKNMEDLFDLFESSKIPLDIHTYNIIFEEIAWGSYETQSDEKNSQEKELAPLDFNMEVLKDPEFHFEYKKLFSVYEESSSLTSTSKSASKPPKKIQQVGSKPSAIVFAKTTQMHQYISNMKENSVVPNLTTSIILATFFGYVKNSNFFQESKCLPFFFLEFMEFSKIVFIGTETSLIFNIMSHFPLYPLLCSQILQCTTLFLRKKISNLYTEKMCYDQLFQSTLL